MLQGKEITVKNDETSSSPPALAMARAWRRSKSAMNCHKTSMMNLTAIPQRHTKNSLSCVHASNQKATILTELKNH